MFAALDGELHGLVRCELARCGANPSPVTSGPIRSSIAPPSFCSGASELLTSLVTGADPFKMRDREPTVRSILDAGAERVERELDDR